MMSCSLRGHRKTTLVFAPKRLFIRNISTSTFVVFWSPNLWIIYKRCDKWWLTFLAEKWLTNELVRFPRRRRKKYDKKAREWIAKSSQVKRFAKRNVRDKKRPRHGNTRGSKPWENDEHNTRKWRTVMKELRKNKSHRDWYVSSKTSR